MAVHSVLSLLDHSAFILADCSVLYVAVVLPEYFSAALSLLNLLENSLGHSKPTTRLMQAQQHTVWNISTISLSKPYWTAFYRNKMWKKKIFLHP